MTSFISELRRRNVLRVAAAYALVAWIIIEAGSVLLPTFGASDTVFQAYVILVLIGFLVSLVLAWIYEITPDGVVLERDLDRDNQATERKPGLTNRTITGLLVIALIVSITFNVTTLDTDAGPSAAEIMASRQSIAVLPFANRSTDANNALFVDGVHDDLLSKLANIGSLRVISRTSVMEYRDTTKNLRQIGEELNVDTLLEGSVMRVGDTVRINVQLIDAETDEHLWARIYDRQIDDDNLFAVQSEVSAEIAAALHTTLMPAEQHVVADVPTENLRAYSLYHSARDNLYRRRLDTLLEARGQLEQAVELDPEYAEAYVALAENIIVLMSNHQVISSNEALSLAAAHLDRAFDLDPDLSDAWATLGLLKTTEWTLTRLGNENLDAESAFERALALNPNNARAYMWFAILRDAEQQTDEAIGYYHRSMQLDPLGRVPYTNLPGLYAQKGENEYAIRLWLDAVELHPDWSVPYQMLSTQLAAMGRLDEALAWERLMRERNLPAGQAGNLAMGIYAEFGDLERALQTLDSRDDNHPLAPFTTAFRYVLNGDYAAGRDEMLKLIEANEDLPVFAPGLASDFALLSGDNATAREQMYLQNPVMQLDAELEIDRFTVRDVVKLAYILKQEGNTARSTELLNAALPVVQSLPRLGVFGQGVRDAQIYALLGQSEDALAALRQAIDEGYRSSVIADNWLLRIDPYFGSLNGNPKFAGLLDELAALNDEMYQRVLNTETDEDWDELTSQAGAS